MANPSVSKVWTEESTVKVRLLDRHVVDLTVEQASNLLRQLAVATTEVREREGKVTYGVGVVPDPEHYPNSMSIYEKERQ